MRRVTSMLEVGDIRKIRDLDDSLPSISETSQSTPVKQLVDAVASDNSCSSFASNNSNAAGAIVAIEEDDDDDDDFFIGGDDDDDENDHEYSRTHPAEYEVPIAPPSGGGGERTAASASFLDATMPAAASGQPLRRRNSCVGLSASMPSALPSTSTSSSSAGMRRTSSILKLSNSSGAAGPKKPQRNISFSNLQVREYDLTLGDHPNCSFGPPVQLSWNYTEGATRNLEEYHAEKEELDLSTNRGRRGGKKGVQGLSWEKREALLKRQGFSEKEMKDSRKEVQKIKISRSLTKTLVVTGRTEEALESAGRKMRRFLGGKKK